MMMITMMMITMMMMMIPVQALPPNYVAITITINFQRPVVSVREQEPVVSLEPLVIEIGGKFNRLRP